MVERCTRLVTQIFASNRPIAATPQPSTVNISGHTINSSLVSPDPRLVSATLSDRDFERRSTVRLRRAGTLPADHPFRASYLLEVARLVRTFPWEARSSDTRYYYCPPMAAAQVPDIVVDTVVVVVAAAAAAVLTVAADMQTTKRQTSTEVPSTSSTSPPSAGTLRRKK